MNNTGVFSTEEEKSELSEMLKQAKNTPVILVGEVPLALNPYDDMIKRCHALALKHKLPEIVGYYGINLKTGEFISV